MDAPSNSKAADGRESDNAKGVDDGEASAQERDLEAKCRTSVFGLTREGQATGEGSAAWHPREAVASYPDAAEHGQRFRVALEATFGKVVEAVAGN